MVPALQGQRHVTYSLASVCEITCPPFAAARLCEADPRDSSVVEGRSGRIRKDKSECFLEPRFRELPLCIIHFPVSVKGRSFPAEFTIAPPYTEIWDLVCPSPAPQPW